MGRDVFGMQLEFTDEEVAALFALMGQPIAIDLLFLLPQTRTLRGIRPNILGMAPSEPPPAQPQGSGWPRR